VIAAEGLTHRYGSRLALDNLSFETAEAEIFGLLGPNGGGKSTLFRILATMMAPSGGRARVAGFDVAAQSNQVRRLLGVVFQSCTLDRKLTVEENLTAQGRFYGLSGADLARRIDAVLDRLRLAERRRDLVETLSGGLARRADVAKALLHDPRVLLLDEPSTGLDPAARRELMDHIHGLRDTSRVTVLLTTHILDEADRCDRLLLLHQGRRVAEGTPAALKAKVSGDVVELESADPVALGEKIARRFALRPVVSNGSMRIESPGAHRLVAELFEAFPGEIRSIQVHRPTLEDVFLDQTGARIS
jgi:ABC-2 type transport system ATP-binding protein